MLPPTSLRPVGAISLAAVIGGVHPHQLDEIIDAIGKPSRIFTRRDTVQSERTARLWRDQGKPMQARELLAPVYGWFHRGL